MKRNIFIQLACSAAVAMCFVSCSQDELSSPTELVEGAYPLQIATVTIADGQPSTRVTENDDRMGSTWEVGDRIYVKFEGRDEVGILSITDAATGAVEVVEPIYWTSPNATVIAWHTSSGEPDKMDVSDQTGGIAYMVGCKTQVNFGETINLSLSHQLCKVRVYPNDFAPAAIAGITLKYPAAYTISDGSLTASATDGLIRMYSTTAEGRPCFEATVIPGTLTSSNTFVVTQADGYEYEMGFSTDFTLDVGKVSIVEIVGGESPWIDLSSLRETYTISGDGSHYFYGSGVYSIRVAAGNPTIHLLDASISVNSGNAISIESGANATIQVIGNSVLQNIATGKDTSYGGYYGLTGAGIFVAEGSTVTVTSRDRYNDVLTARGGSAGSGIGGYVTRFDSAMNCGNIVITNATVYAYGSYSEYSVQVAPGIGGAGRGSCGNITINDATVYAYGVAPTKGSPGISSPAIGSGMSYRNTKGTFGTITIQNSEVYVQRGNSYCDYIGYSGRRDDAATGAVIAAMVGMSTLTKLN